MSGWFLTSQGTEVCALFHTELLTKLCTFCFLLQRPWHEYEHNFQIMYRVGMGHKPPIPDKVSPEGKDFLCHCLESDPKMRWTASQLLDHPFVKVCLTALAAKTADGNQTTFSLAVSCAAMPQGFVSWQEADTKLMPNRKKARCGKLRWHLCCCSQTSSYKNLAPCSMLCCS